MSVRYTYFAELKRFFTVTPYIYLYVYSTKPARIGGKDQKFIVLQIEPEDDPKRSEVRGERERVHLILMKVDPKKSFGSKDRIGKDRTNDSVSCSRRKASLVRIKYGILGETRRYMDGTRTDGT